MDSEETESKEQRKEDCDINRLPSDLIERVFLKLQVSTLLKCSEVCKQWYRLIRDPQFVTAHLKQAPSCALLFFPQQSVLGKLYPSDAILFDEAWSQSTVAVPVIGPDDFLCGSCNGLICLYTKASTIKIANLATGECLYLDKPVKNLKGDSFSLYRFGFHPVIKEYKVIHFLAEHKKYSRGTIDIIQVYTLGSEKWKDVKTLETLSLSCVKFSGVVIVDGAMYWLTEDAGVSWGHALISFDLSEENFTRIQLPQVALGGYHQYWITEIEGKVCVATAEVHHHRPKMLAGKLQIWTLDSVVEQSWCQMYSVQYAPNYIPGSHFVHRDKILMQSFDCNLYLYELFGNNCETKLSKSVRLLDFSPYKPDNLQSYKFVKSLVRLEAYKNVGILHGSRRRDGWESKKWEAWERQIGEVEYVWRNIYQLEQSSLALPRYLGMSAKELLRHLPDEVIQQRTIIEIDQILQHLPDCPEEYPRSRRRLNWVEMKRDSEMLSARMTAVKDITKASSQADRDIRRAIYDLRDHFQVIYRGTYWARFWSLLLKEEERRDMHEACRNLEITMMDIFAKHGWRFTNRLCA